MRVDPAADRDGAVSGQDESGPGASGATGGTGEAAGCCAGRRGVLAGVGLIGLAGLAGACAAGGGGGGSEGSGAAGTVLGKTGDIPVGGGMIFPEAKVVVTQPVQGQFKAFSAVCTHAGCTVGSVARGVISCPCHGSQFKIEDASIENGPATQPLPARQIKVTGDTITLA